MRSEPVRTPEGEAGTDVVLGVFRTNGFLVAAGDQLAAQEGLTAARWQVLGALALADRPLTVPQIARRMGLTRQAVQASVNRLLGDALVEALENPDHRRSPLFRMTAAGSTRYEALERRQIRWINDLASGLKRSDLAAAARVLQRLGDKLDDPRHGQDTSRHSQHDPARHSERDAR
jgi:DNA-binding MarR family transcriptional regulator